MFQPLDGTLTVYVDGLVARLRERRKVYETRLSSGAIANLEEYKLVVGKLQGLDEALMATSQCYKELIAGRDVNDNRAGNS